MNTIIFFPGPALLHEYGIAWLNLSD